MSTRHTFVQNSLSVGVGLFAAAQIATGSELKGVAVNEVKFDKAHERGCDPAVFLLVLAN
jgi:hypothetical protein